MYQNSYIRERFRIYGRSSLYHTQYRISIEAILGELLFEKACFTKFQFIHSTAYVDTRGHNDEQKI